MSIKDRLSGAYQFTKNVKHNFQTKGDVEKVGYGLLVAGVAYGIVPVQGFLAFGMMKTAENLHIPAVPMGILAVAMYSASKIAIFEMNRRMLFSKKWCADYHTDAFSFAGLSPTKAAAAGIVSDIVIGTAVNMADLTGLGAIGATLLTGQENHLAASIFISKSLLFPVYYAGANLLIQKGKTDPIVNKTKELRFKYLRKHH